MNINQYESQVQEFIPTQVINELFSEMMAQHRAGASAREFANYAVEQGYPNVIWQVLAIDSLADEMPNVLSAIDAADKIFIP